MLRLESKRKMFTSVTKYCIRTKDSFTKMKTTVNYKVSIGFQYMTIHFHKQYFSCTFSSTIFHLNTQFYREEITHSWMTVQHPVSTLTADNQTLLPRSLRQMYLHYRYSLFPSINNKPCIMCTVMQDVWNSSTVRHIQMQILTHILK